MPMLQNVCENCLWILIEEKHRQLHMFVKKLKEMRIQKVIVLGKNYVCIKKNKNILFLFHVYFLEVAVIY